jgi:hypothetical protein
MGIRFVGLAFKSLLRVATAINDDERLEYKRRKLKVDKKRVKRYSGKGAHDGLTQ